MSPTDWLDDSLRPLDKEYITRSLRLERDLNEILHVLAVYQSRSVNSLIEHLLKMALSNAYKVPPLEDPVVYVREKLKDQMR